MILFAPAYDPATRSNHRMALRFEDRASFALLNEDATRVRLLLALQASTESLVAFSHGTHDGFKGQDAEMALVSTDAPSLGGRRTFVYACHTGTDLGRTMALSGIAWWGYTGPITAPPDHADEADIVAPVFEYLVTAFLGNQDPGSLPEIFDRLQSRCAEAEERLDVMGEDVDMEAYFCLLHIWARLRVWWPGIERPLHHPGCPIPLLLLD